MTDAERKYPVEDTAPDDFQEINPGIEEETSLRRAVERGANILRLVDDGDSVSEDGDDYAEDDTEETPKPPKRIGQRPFKKDERFHPHKIITYVLPIGEDRTVRRLMVKDIRKLDPLEKLLYCVGNADSVSFAGENRGAHYQRFLLKSWNVSVEKADDELTMDGLQARLDEAEKEGYVARDTEGKYSLAEPAVAYIFDRASVARSLVDSQGKPVHGNGQQSNEAQNNTEHVLAAENKDTTSIPATMSANARRIQARQAAQELVDQTWRSCVKLAREIGDRDRYDTIKTRLDNLSTQEMTLNQAKNEQKKLEKMLEELQEERVEHGERLSACITLAEELGYPGLVEIVHNLQKRAADPDYIPAQYDNDFLLVQEYFETLKAQKIARKNKPANV